MNDHRSHSLYAILRASWLLQVDDILLECVANVIHFPLAQQSIDDFAQLTDMHIFKLIFDLQDQWPVRRNRFWCRMMRKTVPKVEIPRWPTTQCYRKLGDIMPLDAIWDELIEPFIWIHATAQIKEFSLIMTKLQQSCTHGDMSIDLALADVVQLSVSPDFVQEEHEVLA